jgi:hypothetical protein
MDDITEQQSRGTGKRWGKGQSGNPAGQPKYELYRNGDKVPRNQYDIINKKVTSRAQEWIMKHGFDALADIALNAENAMARKAAITEMWNRAFGPPKATVKIEGQIDHQHEHKVVSFGEAIRQLHAKLTEELEGNKPIDGTIINGEQEHNGE